MKEIFAYIDANKACFLDELKDLVRIPSVSAQIERRNDLQKAAKWVADKVKSLGFKVEMTDPEGKTNNPNTRPVIYAEGPKKSGKPTVLFYGHYDVQPPGNLSRWIAPPFEPTERDGHLYARGATDDKGQVMMHLCALEALNKAGSGVPVNLKILIEGEEEVIDTHLEAYIRANRRRLAADIAVVSDTAAYDIKHPAVTYGLRGIAECHLEVIGPNDDKHSGEYGGTLHNPAHVLSRIVATLHDRNGKVAVKGFYNDVKPLAKWEREMWRKLPFRETSYAKSLGISQTYGEKGYTTLERRWGRPTLDITGMQVGHAEGSDTNIIPHRAWCRVTMRLVPDQNPDRMCKLLEQHVCGLAPKGVRVNVHKRGGQPAVLVDTSGPYMEAAKAAMKAGFGRNPVLVREGGSIPVVGMFKNILKIDTLLVGCGLHDDHIHGANEKFTLSQFYGGIKMAAALYTKLGEF